MTTLPTPPQDIDAEQHVLGAAMLSPKAADIVLDRLRPESFYREAHRRVFTAIGELRSKGVDADVISLRSLLSDKQARDIVGLLVELCPTVGNVRHHCDLVREAWLKRASLRRLYELSEFAANGATAEEVLTGIENVGAELRHTAGAGRPARAWSMADAVADLRRKLESPPDDSTGIPTPFRRLDRLQPGRLYVLAGYPGDGKTAAAMQFFRSAAEAGRRTTFFTLEMSREDLRDRLMATFGVPYGWVAKGRPLGAARDTLAAAMATVEKWPARIIDDASTPEAIRRSVRVTKPEFVIVDHLHRIDWKDRRELERAVQAFTNLALTENIPVLLLAQLHRSRNSDDFPRPTMASIRETGVVEQEAAAVWAIYRKREGGVRKDESTFLVLKNRFGREGTIDLLFSGPEVHFTEVVDGEAA